MILRALFIALLLLPAAPARAADICNETSFIVEVALGWVTESSEIAVEGWTRVRPGECVESGPTFDPESDRPLLFYARSTAAYLGGVREWGGQLDLCVGASDFAVEGVSDCESLGLDRRGFDILRGDHRLRTVLVEPADYGDDAQEAGTQRLLRDAGFDIRTIDGLEGRRTFRAISAFVQAEGLPSTPPRAELIDALEAAAIRRNADAGLVICNETEGRIAVALGRQRNEEWESRGWWRLDAGGCARLLAEHLDEANAWFYAERTGDTPGRLQGGTESFCYSPSRFVAEGRTECAGRGYGTGLFRIIPDPVDGTSRIALTINDFRVLERTAPVEPQE
ncbi:DUF1036 domain-containing protein [Hyphobacterium sp. HN65]|uniref:DUF1036 domain-containing protein n=1 Tax=Hyphobacterium lacteum TaxID=3116575 RepID=A0ABU7LNK2_9PROT|nr:DUF1036 domain-containing protein [Hyphobacterium sp. HN65]MEE2525482.1 DUF1036 domain-containing protein [Hyphobacterium sp. HN65]